MTESKKDSILRKVRALMAKANSTEHEGERQVFMAKADELMEQYAIETWMLESGQDESKAKIIEKRQFDMSWWSELGNLPHDCKSQVWHLFAACAAHCRCYTNANGIWAAGGVPVWGMAADLDYLNLLFTDLFVQLFGKLKPAYDPDKSMGHNVAIAKEAGMKYLEVAKWLGHPEWVVPNGTGGFKAYDRGKMLREYKAYLKSIGKTQADVVSVHPHTYAYSFLIGFVSTIRSRFAQMNQQHERTSGAELVLRDIREQAKEGAFAEFPNWAKSTGLSRSGGGRNLSTQGTAMGGTAGANARIAGRDSKLTSNSRKQLN